MSTCFYGDVGTHQNGLTEAILMSTHNIRFSVELTKIILKYPPYLFHCYLYHI